MTLSNPRLTSLLALAAAVFLTTPACPAQQPKEASTARTETDESGVEKARLQFDEARQRYEAARSAATEAMVAACERAEKQVAASKKRKAEEAARVTARLRAERLAFVRNPDEVPSSPEVRSDVRTFLKAMQSARADFRKKAGAVVQGLRRQERDEWQPLQQELDQVCPRVIELPAFVAAVEDVNKKVQTVVNGRSNPDAKEARDELAALLLAAQEMNIGAGELTRRTQALIDKIGHLEAVRVGNPKGRAMQEAADRLRSLLAD